MGSVSGPTIRDVAREAGVSVTTVSDSMSGKGRVDPRTRELVRRTAEQLGWQPRRAAQTLRSGRSGVIALCLPRRPVAEQPWLLSRDYYLVLAAACATAAVEHDQLMLLVPGTISSDDVARTHADGVIVVDPSRDDENAVAFEAADIPYVTVDRDLASDSPWWVSADETSSMRELLDHLAAVGSRRIALLSSSEPWSWFHDVEEVYEQWCRAHGVAPRRVEVDLSRPIESSRELTHGLLDEEDAPDAIIGVPYGAALGAHRAAGERGLWVGDGLRIASGVDGHVLTTVDPAITAIDLVPAEVGAAAVDVLARRISGEPPGDPIVVPARVHLRQSTAR